MNTYKTEENSKYVFWAIISLLVIFMINSICEENRYKKDNIESVAYVYDISVRKYAVFYADYKYRFDNEWYTRSIKIDAGQKDQLIKRYFKINLSSSNPDYSKIFLDQEITNAKLIENAGFRYE